MASIVLKRALLSAPSRHLPIAARAAPAAVGNRSFNTNTMRDLDNYEDERNLDRRSDSDAFRSFRGDVDDPLSLGGVFDPFNPTRSLSQVMNLMNQMLDGPFAAVIPRGAAGGLRRGWNVREDAEALHLSVDMPGLGKERVKVWAEQNTLVIKGESETEPGESADGEVGDAPRRYSSRIELPSDAFKMDQIRAEMKNGVLKVVVPKLKHEDRREVFQVKIE